MTADNPYLDDRRFVRDPADIRFDAIEGPSLVFETAGTKPGHFRQIVIPLDRLLASLIADVLWDYHDAEAADVRKFGDRLRRAS